MNSEEIAKVAHEISRAYCLSLGDTSQVSWEQASYGIQQSVIDGVNYLLQNPNALPSDSHDNWLEFKKREGWVYGLIKSEKRKTHPYMVPYNKLPQSDRSKDYIFAAIVESLA